MTDVPALDTELDPPERDLAVRLTDQRPVPGAEFRGILGRHLAARDPGYGPRPGRLRTSVGLYLGAGVGIVVLGALQGMGVL
jgi:hypothetical protein